ncbi:MAG: hypothetical protein KAI17_22005, partial [Thiotrichaceae bacterium]|nr:hypothetical protein [Thiotrichaceae bacterium]
MSKNIVAIITGACLAFFSGISSAGFFESDWWNEAIYSVSDPVAVDGGVSQSGTAELYFSNVDANLTSQVQGIFEENGFDTLTASFEGNGKTIGFTDLGRDAAEQWAEDNADDLIQIVFGSMGRSLAGQDAAHAESDTVMSEMILTPSRGSKQKAKGLTISTLNNRAEGALSYTSFDN